LGQPLFQSELDIDPTQLKIRFFRESQRVKTFSCGDKELDNFLNTAEVEDFERENFGITYLVFYQGNLVAYFTISFDGLRREYVKTYKSFTKPGMRVVESIPCIKIGRLAVQIPWQKKGIGRSLIKYIAASGLETRTKGGLRLIIVEARAESQRFYEQCGFILTDEVKRERKKVHRTMFFDLGALDDVIKPG
jgi:predicted GNAT family N-acyltransferase